MLKEREGGSPAAELCAGCGARIADRYYLLAVDRAWHAPCLRCCECKLGLDSELTCFARDGNIYCKDDYYRLFSVKRCGRCGSGITANELVMRARDMVYHLACFTCAACGTPLAKGDMFGVRDGLVYCRPHYDGGYATGSYCEDDASGMYSCHDNHAGNSSPAQYYQTAGPAQKGRPRKRKLHPSSPDDLQVQTMRMASSALEILHRGELSSSMESLSYDSSVASPGSTSGHHSQRTKRMRTSFKHHQLRTMKSYFAINQNPDAKDLKQLAQKTGLSKRVLQVWFQNARAKWRRNIMRQEAGQVTQGANGGGSSISGPSLGSALMMGENGALSSHQSQQLDDLRLHTPHGPHTGMGFGEIY